MFLDEGTFSKDLPLLLFGALKIIVSLITLPFMDFVGF
jgi:hypothetical protein